MALGNIKYAVIILILLLTLVKANAQQNNTLYYMVNVPQSNLLNPARQFPCKSYLGIPFLSSIHENFSNTGFAYYDLVDKNDQSVTLENLTSKVRNTDYISNEFHYQYLAYGRRIKEKYYFTFSLQEKNEVYFTYPVDLMTIALKGNIENVGANNELNLNDLGPNVLHYREYAFGLSKRQDEFLTYGLKAKILFGKGNVNAKKMKIGISTSENYLNWTVDVDTRVNSSGPASLDENYNLVFDESSFSDFNTYKTLFFNRKNPGFALDGGFIYQYSDKFQYSGSFIDLGIIRWRDAVTNLSSEGTFTYRGLTQEQIEEGDFAQSMYDEIMTTFAPSITNEKYWTWLPLKVYLGANYQVLNRMDIGLLARGMIYQLKLYPTLIFSVNTYITRGLNLSASYAFNNYSWNNFGLGLAFPSKNFHFYLVLDNIPFRYGTVSDQSPGFLSDMQGIPVPVTARNLNLRLGFNLMFGCKERVDEEPCYGCYWINRKLQKNEKKEQFLQGKCKKKKRRKLDKRGLRTKKNNF